MAFNPLEELDVAFLIIRRQKSVYHLNCESSDKIGDVRRYLASLMKLSEENIQLWFADNNPTPATGEALDPEKTLRDYNLTQATSPAENPCVLGMCLRKPQQGETISEFEPLEIIRYPPPAEFPTATTTDGTTNNKTNILKPPTTLEFKGDYRGPEVAFQEGLVAEESLPPPPQAAEQGSSDNTKPAAEAEQQSQQQSKPPAEVTK